MGCCEAFLPCDVRKRLAVLERIRPMNSVLSLFIMVDACGWEIIAGDPFAASLAPNRKRLKTVFGYSSACVPSILSGRYPVDHRNWCYFVYDPKHSPFRALRPLRWLPSFVSDRRIFRRRLSKAVARHLRLSGYFDLYNIPFADIDQYDFTEKKSPLKPRGMNRGENIFDFLEARRIHYYVSDPVKTEDANFSDLAATLRHGQPDFAFLYWPGLDALMHRAGNDSPEVHLKLCLYENRIEALLAAAHEAYHDVHLYIFSDHGMANCDELLDLKSVIGALEARNGRDYRVVYDSTMARFWFFNREARAEITEALNGVEQGRILPDSELEEMGTLFPDRYFGELIFLVREGVLIVPSDMGHRPLRAMHGYHPSAKHSYAALLTNQPAIPDEVDAIPDIFHLMTREAELARTANRRSGSQEPDAVRHSEKALIYGKC
jgi:hypothetical protein